MCSGCSSCNTVIGMINVVVICLKPHFKFTSALFEYLHLYMFWWTFWFHVPCIFFFWRGVYIYMEMHSNICERLRCTRSMHRNGVTHWQP